MFVINKEIKKPSKVRSDCLNTKSVVNCDTSYKMKCLDQMIEHGKYLTSLIYSELNPLSLQLGVFVIDYYFYLLYYLCNRQLHSEVLEIKVDKSNNCHSYENILLNQNGYQLTENTDELNFESVVMIPHPNYLEYQSGLENMLMNLNNLVYNISIKYKKYEDNQYKVYILENDYRSGLDWSKLDQNGLIPTVIEHIINYIDQYFEYSPINWSIYTAYFVTILRKNGKCYHQNRSLNRIGRIILIISLFWIYGFPMSGVWHLVNSQRVDHLSIPETWIQIWTRYNSQDVNQNETHDAVKYLMNLTMNRTEYLLNKKVSPLFSRFCQQINESICDQNVDLNELELIRQIQRESSKHYEGLIPLWYHVCSTVCSNKMEYNRYPQCKCSKIGGKISKSIIRNAVSRIFVNPYQSIIEPIVNGIDAYKTDAKHSVGKFGMGFFSLLYWLIGFPSRKIVIVTKTIDNPQSYQIEIRETSGYLGFKIEKIDNYFDCGHYTDIKLYMDPYYYLEDIERGKYKNGNMNFNKSIFKLFISEIDHLRLYKRNPIYLNGRLYNDQITLMNHENSIYINFINGIIQIHDNGSGISLNNILRFLLIPSVSTKTVRLLKEVSGTNMSTIRRNLERNYSQMVITVNDIIIVDIKIEIADLLIVNELVSIYKRRYGGCEMILSLPENVQLPVDRSDIILDKYGLNMMKLELTKIYNLMKSADRNIIPLQKALNNYYQKSSQKSQINELIEHVSSLIDQSINDRKLVPLKPQMLKLFDMYQSMKHPKYVLVDDVYYDEDQLITNIVKLTDISLNLFNEKKIVFSDNLETCETFGTYSWLFVPNKYNPELEPSMALERIDQIRYASPIYLTTSHLNMGLEMLDKYKSISKFVELLSNSEISNKFKHLILMSVNRHTLLKNLLNRYSNDIETKSLIEKDALDSLIMFYRSIKSSNDENVKYFQSFYNMLKLYLEIDISLLEKIRNDIDKQHVTYGVNLIDLAKIVKLNGKGGLSKFNMNYFKNFLNSKPFVLIKSTINQIIENSDIQSVSLIYQNNWYKTMIQEINSEFDIEFKNGVGYLYYLGLKALNYITDEIINENAKRDIINFLETKLDKSKLLSELNLILVGYGLNRHMLDNYVIETITGIIDRHNNINTFITKKIYPYDYESDQMIYLSELIRLALMSDKPLELLLKEPIESKLDLQIIELAINSGTTMNYLESAVTELVQNSIDAIRTNKDSGSIMINYGQTEYGDYYLSVIDDIGIQYQSLLSLIVPYYSAKDSVVSIGEMGNGFFNVYRKASEILINSKHEGEPGFIILDIPQKNDNFQVVDVKKYFTWRTTRLTNGTSIYLLFQNNSENRVNFNSLHQILPRFLTIIPSIATITINYQMNNNNYYHHYYYEPNKHLVEKEFNPNNLKSDMAVLFCVNRNCQSYVLTKGVPFMTLSEFLVLYLPNMKPLIPYLVNGLVLYLVKYEPVQSRTNIRISEQIKSQILSLLEHSLFIYQITGIESLLNQSMSDDLETSGSSRHQMNKYIDNFSSTADPRQLGFTNINKYDGRLSSFMTYHQMYHFNHNIATMINHKIQTYTSSNMIVKFSDLVPIDRIGQMIIKLMTSWFLHKRVSPIVTEYQIDKTIPTNIPITPNHNYTFDQQLSTVIIQSFQLYIDIYCNIARNRLNIEKFYTNNPTIRIIVDDQPRPIAGYYSQSNHQITIILSVKSEIDQTIVKWKQLFLSILENKQDNDQYYKLYFFNSKHTSCIMDHELEHARNGNTHQSIYSHGSFNIKYIDEPMVFADFEKIAIKTRTKMDQLGFTVEFLKQVKILLQSINPEL